MSPNAKQADKHRVISVALLNNHINPNTLKTLSMQLKNRFKYFEILLLNPIVEQDSINKDSINLAKKNSEFNNKKDSEAFIKSQINKNNNENQKLTNVTPPPPVCKNLIAKPMTKIWNLSKTKMITARTIIAIIYMATRKNLR